MGGLRDEKRFAGTAVTALSASFGLAGSLVMYAAGRLGPVLSFAYRVGAVARREATEVRYAWVVFFGIMIFARKADLAAGQPRLGRSLDSGTWRD